MVLPGTCVSALGFSFGPSQPVGGNVFLCLVPPSSPLPRWQGPSFGLSPLGRHLRKPLDWVVRFTSSLPATPGPLLVCHTKTYQVTQCACQITSRQHSIALMSTYEPQQTAQRMRSLLFITTKRYHSRTGEGVICDYYGGVRSPQWF